eukprot:CAMPEP_0201593012 /NCGR_PEP_ID=MMETSP0190_2-20130828/190742_1 /ASSEMBLY_ACC=CAM_ASM_000263 /TAXON_ID=37353 /ORGANISM="Rosalina sp." /LENGTH=337 /DNA_ID=CAMNT_0048052031 /DNA_START=591 /DNA_END=1601 /DNA_ORIENTATION=+
MKQRQGLQSFLDAQVEKTAERIKAEQAAQAAAQAAASAAAKPEPVVTQPEAKPEPKPEPEPQRVTTSATANKSDDVAAGEAIKSERKEPELTREERLEIEREREMKKEKEREEEDERLRAQIQQIKEQQERVSIERASSDDGRASIKTSKMDKEDKKRARAKKAEKNKREREKADKEARRKIAAQRRKRRNKRYKINPGDQTDYESDSSEYETDPDATDDDEEEEEDVATLLPRFNKIAAMGQLFFRHAGARSRNKPQDRVVKLHFDSHGKPKEISWGSGSRHIYWKDVLYVSNGHWTPVFDVRKDVLDSKKCFSVVSKDGKTLDLEGYSENVAELW